MARDQSSTASRTRRSLLAGAGALGAAALAGCTQSSGGGSGGTTDGETLSGKISITGSSTVYPLANRMTNLFKDKHPDVTFSTSPTGTGGGFSNYFCKGKSMINNASRPITEAEQQQCANNGVEPVQLEVARDAITVIVNPEADWVDCMSFEELAQIWRPDNPAQKWSDVNSEWPDKEITLWGAADTSGTYDFFTEAVVGEEGASRSDYNGTEHDNQIVAGVKQDKYALGYLGYAYYRDNKNSVKALGLKKGDGSCVKPSIETARTGNYPLARPLFTYPAKSALSKDRVAEFCRFWLQKSTSDKIVADTVGYVPNSPETQQNMMDRLNSAIEDANAE
ncbi:MAG: PstS family phosphate ABC transporter substrate-binding protein [Halobacteriaceae archaeon]